MIQIRSEMRIWGVVCLIVLLLLAWTIDKGRDIARLEERTAINIERMRQLEHRNADLLAWVVTTREKMIEWSRRAGAPFTPPPVPESLLDKKETDNGTGRR